MHLKNSVLFLALYLIAIPCFAHDIQVARFEISHNGGNNYTLSIKFDRDDLVNAVSETSDKSKPIKQQIFQYVESNFSLNFNGEKVDLEFGNVIYEKEMILVNGNLNTTVRAPKQIEITNTCLPKLEDHNNIVEFDFYGKLRTFRLTSERTSTTFEYE